MPPNNKNNTQVRSSKVAYGSPRVAPGGVPRVGKLLLSPPRPKFHAWKARYAPINEQYTKNARRNIPRDILPRGSRELGVGKSGTVFSARGEVFFDWIDGLGLMGISDVQIEAGPEPIPSRFVVKVTAPTDTVTDYIQEGEFEREVRLLKHVQSAKPSTVNGVTFGSGTIVPRFLFSCKIRRGPQRFYVMAQEEAAGTLLEDALGSGKQVDARTRKKYIRRIVSYERALISLWLAGVSHNDAHGANALVSNETVRLIDLGRGAELTAKAVALIKAELVTLNARSDGWADAPDALERVWVGSGVHEGIANRYATHSVGIAKGFWSNGGMPRYFLGLVPRPHLGELERARRGPGGWLPASQLQERGNSYILARDGGAKRCSPGYRRNRGGGDACERRRNAPPNPMTTKRGRSV